jgi:hypothetical protein
MVIYEHKSDVNRWSCGYLALYKWETPYMLKDVYCVWVFFGEATSSGHIRYQAIVRTSLECIVGS